MSMIDFLRADPLETAERFEKAAADLRYLQTEGVPDPASLSCAPLLQKWGAAQISTLVLTGQVYRHPYVGDGRTAITSPILAINREHGWARTLSRFYLLGSAGLFGLDG